VTEPQLSDLSQASEPDAPLTHPEEMKAVFNLKIGDKISLQGSARMTPAGVVSGGIALSAILAAIGFIVWVGWKKS
jgi:hypothetical protein